MKWFKHFTDASEDEFITLLEARHGLDGYGRWFKLLEQIAKNMDKSNRAHAEHPWAFWLANLRGKGKTVGAFFATCIEEGKLDVWQRDDETGQFLKLKPEHFKNVSRTFLKRSENVLKMKCPKLLNLRDNHTRNLQATCKQEVEVEVYKTDDVEPAGTESQKGKMNLTDIGTLYKQTFNKLQVPGMLLADLRDITELFTPDQITAAFQDTARGGGRSLKYTMAILQTGDKPRKANGHKTGNDIDSFLAEGDQHDEHAMAGQNDSIDAQDAPSASIKTIANG